MTIVPNLREALPGVSERLKTRLFRSRPRGTWERIEDRIRYYAEHPEKIKRRLHELDREWDMERVLEARISTLALLGIGLSILDRRFLVIPGIMTGFLLLHAARGWSPPVPLLRRLGTRTRAEILAERNSLQALKEAFADLGERLEEVGQTIEGVVRKTG